MIIRKENEQCMQINDSIPNYTFIVSTVFRKASAYIPLSISAK